MTDDRGAQVSGSSKSPRRYKPEDIAQDWARPEWRPLLATVEVVDLPKPGQRKKERMFRLVIQVPVKALLVIGATIGGAGTVLKLLLDSLQ